MYIIESPAPQNKKFGPVLGSVTFESCFQYTRDDWVRDRAKHCVKEFSRFDFTADSVRPRFGWNVCDVGEIQVLSDRRMHTKASMLSEEHRVYRSFFVLPGKEKLDQYVALLCVTIPFCVRRLKKSDVTPKHLLCTNNEHGVGVSVVETKEKFTKV